MGKLIKRMGLAVPGVAMVAAAAVPGPVSAADHLDAPGLTSPGGDSQLDIADL